MTAFFGCWGDVYNKIAKDSAVPWFTRVIAAVKAAAMGAERITKVVVAGDNYYMKKLDQNPEEDFKRKIYDPAQIQALFNELNTGIPTVVLYGNHEWDKFNSKDAENQCTVIEAEKSAVVGPVRLLDTLVERDKADLWVMLDTSMFEYADDDLQCYHGNLPTLRSEQMAKVVAGVHAELEQGPVRRVFIVGHHPICIFRTKVNKKKGLLTYLNVNAKLARAVSEVLTQFPKDEVPLFHYLCADFHVYQHQHLVINGIPLTMHIVGTGGAELDQAYTPTPESTRIDNAGSSESPDKSIIFYEETAEPVQVTFDTKGALDAVTSDQVRIHSELVGSQAGYGYLKIDDDRMQFVPVGAVGGRSRRKRRMSRKRRKSRRKRVQKK